MDRITQLIRIYEDCRQWLDDNQNASYTDRIAIMGLQLSALKEQTELIKQQFKHYKKWRK